MTTPTFSVIEWVELSGRGWLAMVECDVERPRDGVGLVGETVALDGVAYRCRGVDRALILRPIRVGEVIGLLVDRKGNGQ